MPAMTPAERLLTAQAQRPDRKLGRPRRAPHRNETRRGLQIGHVAGIAIRVHSSVVVIAALLTWSLATDALPNAASGYPTAVYWTLAAVVAVAFLVALLAHELSHSIVARRHGVKVESITLWMLGGLAALESDPGDATAALRIALAGPAMSFALGVGFALGAVAVAALGGPAVIVAALVWLASISAVLAVFNLVPAAPLDGGRVLAALLWRHRGDRVSAAVSATRAGRVFGYVLIALGTLELLAGGTVGGVWFVFLGWFILGSARAEAAATVVRYDLAALPVGRVMRFVPVRVPATMPLDVLVRDQLPADHDAVVPVTAPDGKVVGVVTRPRLEALGGPHLGWRACDVMWTTERVARAEPEESLADLIERMAGTPSGYALVYSGDELVGIVTPSDVAAATNDATARRARGRRSHGQHTAH